MLSGLITLLLFFLAGEFLVTLMAWPVPGSVLGMFLLFVFLLVRKGPSENLKSSSHSLLPYIALFIVPAAVGIVNHMDLLAQEGGLILFAIVVSLLVGIPLAAWIMQRLMARADKDSQAFEKGDQ